MIMKRVKYLTAKEKLDCLLDLEKGIPMCQLEEKYGVTCQSIYRWKKKYDGTLESLENGSCVPHTPHPNSMSKEEIEKILLLIKDFPLATDKEIADLLGNNRNPVTINRLRKKYCSGNKIRTKNDVLCLFDKNSIDTINSKDVYRNLSVPFYVLEVENTKIYIAKENKNNPSYFTPFFTLAMTFSNYKIAENFIKQINNTMPWKVNIKKIELG